MFYIQVYISLANLIHFKIVLGTMQHGHQGEVTVWTTVNHPVQPAASFNINDAPPDYNSLGFSKP